VDDLGVEVDDKPITADKRNLHVWPMSIVQPLYGYASNNRIRFNDRMPERGEIDAAVHCFMAFLYEIIRAHYFVYKDLIPPRIDLNQ